jgi:hypothetical protein
MVRNGQRVKADSIHALARVFDHAEYREFQYFTWKHAIDVLRAISEDRDHEPHRSEATVGGPSIAQEGSLQSDFP